MEYEPVQIQYVMAVIYFGAAVLATIALYTRQALPVVYILLGIIIGPGGLKLLANPELVELFAHFGIIFLLFLLGLDLYPQKLVNLFRSVSIVTFTSSVIFFGVAFLVCLAFGFSTHEALIAGIAAMFSSTIIGLKLLPTTVLHHRHIGELVIGVLLLQDLLAILALVVLKGMEISISFQMVHLFPIIMLPLLVCVAFLLERYVIRQLIIQFEKIREYVFVVTIGWCLGMSQLAVMCGLSYEIGAFTAGVTLAASPISRYIAETLRPIRDFFMILFFVAVGAYINLGTALDVIVPAIVLAAAMLVVKPATFRFLFERNSEKKDTSWEVGFRLGQLSEFSILLAFLAVKLTDIGSDATNLIVIATVLTFIGSSYIVVFRYPTPVAVSDHLRRD